MDKVKKKIMEKAAIEFGWSKQKPIVYLNRAEMIAKMYQLKGCKFAMLFLNTDARLLRKSKYDKTDKNTYEKGQVRKISYMSIMAGAEYENVVNNQRIRENHPEYFEAAEKVWGRRLNGSKTVMEHVNKDKEYNLYFQVIIPTKINPHAPKTKRFFIDNTTGEKIDTKTIECFMPKKSKSKRQETEKEILFRTPKVENVLALVTDKVIYQIRETMS